MHRLAIVLCFASAVASAQATKAPPTKAQTKQDAATKAPPPAPQTKVAAPVGTKAAAPAGTKAAAPAGTKSAAPGGTKVDTTVRTKAATPAAQARPTLAIAAESTARARTPPIMREVFEYDAAGRRDPFFSLLTTAELRPAITDLRLVGIIFDESGQRSVAVMRDIATNTQYRVTTGMTFGRLRVALIRRKAVIFSIEEFGLNRQDSLVLGDTTKARGR